MIILEAVFCAVYTFVSGLETFYVAGSIIFFHSHLLTQALGSHTIYNAIANLQSHVHTDEINSVNTCMSMLLSVSCLVIPVLLVV